MNCGTWSFSGGLPLPFLYTLRDGTGPDPACSGRARDLTLAAGRALYGAAYNRRRWGTSRGRPGPTGRGDGDLAVAADLCRGVDGPRRRRPLDAAIDLTAAVAALPARGASPSTPSPSSAPKPTSTTTDGEMGT